MLLPQAVFDQHVILLGKTRSGKSSALRYMVEHLLDKEKPVCIIDPKGDHWGLKISADGKKAGYPVVIFGGEHGEVPLNARSGSPVAELLATGNRSAIVDLGGWMPGDRTQFWIDFASTYFRTHRGRRWLVIDEVHNFCLSADTEILTKAGWKKYHQIEVGEPAVCFDLKTGEYLYAPIEKLFVLHYEGWMRHLFTDGGIDCLCTPEHRVVLERYQRALGRYRRYPPSFCEARQLPNQAFSIPTGGAPVGPGIPELSPTLLELMGMVISDGSFLNKNGICIGQAVHTRKAGVYTCEYLRGLFEQLGVVVSEYKRPEKARVIHGKKTRSRPSIVFYLGASLSRELMKWLGRELHRIPRKILTDASALQLEALYRGLMMGDGSYCGQSDWVAFYSGAKLGLDGDFQELCLRLGKSASVRPIVGGTAVYLSCRHRHWIQRKGVREQFYSGPVWDVTVPTTGAFVARRNGKVFVTGNCFKGKVMSPDAGKMLHWSNRLASEGLGKGISILAASQRPQKVHNDFLTSCETLVAMRVIHEADRSALKDWIDGCGDVAQGKELVESIAQMKRGEAWVWSPEAEFGPKCLQFPMFKTYDSFKPQGPKEAKLLGWAEVNLDEVRKKLEAAVKEAEANDPNKLRQRVRALEAELRKPQRQASGVQVKTVERVVADPKAVERAVKEVDRQRTEEIAVWHNVVKRLSQGVYAIQREVEKLAETCRAAKLPAHKPVRLPKPKPERRIELAPKAIGGAYQTEVRTRPRIKGALMDAISAAHLPKGERAILIAAAQSGLAARDQLTVLTGYRRSSRDAYIQRLRDRGYIEQDGDGIRATELGIMALGSDYKPLPIGRELQTYWMGRLPQGEKAVLQVLVDEYPEPVTREEIDERTTYRRSSRDAYIQRLLARRLVRLEGRSVMADPMLFD